MRSAFVFALLALAPVRAQVAAVPEAAQPPAPAAASEFVVLENGDMLPGDVRFERVGHGKVAVGERAYQLNQVASFRSEEGEFGVVPHPSPFEAGDILVKKTIDGRVGYYSADLSLPGAHGERSSKATADASAMGGMDFIRTAEGQFKVVNYENLKAAIGHDPAAAKHLSRYQKLGAASWIGVGLGAALIGAGAAVKALNADVGVSAPMIMAGGVGVATGFAFVIPMFRDRQLEAAVAAYNR